MEPDPQGDPEDLQGPPDGDTASSPGPVPPAPPLSPLTPEDGLYVAVVSECFGLERAGAGLLRSCLITAGHLMLLGLASGAQQPPKEQA